MDLHRLHLDRGRPPGTVAASSWRGVGARCVVVLALLTSACGPGEEDVQQPANDVQVGGSDISSNDGGFGDSSTTRTGPCGTDADCKSFELAGPPCTFAVCQVGHCVRKTSADGDACEDGDDCTLDDRCLGGSCQPGTPKSCDDGNPCTIRTCEPFGGACAATATDVGCPSATACNVGVCVAGSCQESSIYATVDLPDAATTIGAQGVAWGARGPTRLLWGVGAVGMPAAALTLMTLGGASIAQLPLESTRASAAVADGVGFVVVGSDGPDASGAPATPDAPATPGQGVAMALDEQGAVLWRASYGTALDDRLDAVARRSDGSFVAVGTRGIGATAVDGKVAPPEGWFVAFGQAGAQSADFFYAGPTATRLHDVVAVGLDALVGGSQRTSNGLSLRPLLARVGVDGSLQSIAQPKQTGRVVRLQRRGDGAVAALIADDGGSAPMVLLFDASWLQIATIPLAGPPDLRGLDASWRADGSVLIVGSRSVDAGLSGPATIAWLGRVGPWGALELSRPVPSLLAAHALLPLDDAIWLAGPATPDGDGQPGPARAIRLDPWGFDSCADAGGCPAILHDCDDGDPCTIDSCDPAKGCLHTPLADASPCGIAKTCVQGACTGG